MLITYVSVGRIHAVLSWERDRDSRRWVPQVKPEDYYVSPFLPPTRADKDVGRDVWFTPEWQRWWEAREKYAVEGNPEIRASLYAAMLAQVSADNPPDRPIRAS